MENVLVKEANAKVTVTKMVIPIDYLPDRLKRISLWNCKIHCAVVGRHNFVTIFCCTKFMTQDILYLKKRRSIFYTFFLKMHDGYHSPIVIVY